MCVFPRQICWRFWRSNRQRAGAFVVGEDLGTVEAQVHHAMEQFRIVGTKVLWFEDDPPAEWPQHALATITTHDLPTLAMVLSARRRADPDQPVDDDEYATTDPVLARLLAVIGDERDPAAAVRAAHVELLASPALLRLMTTDDLAGATRQPNVPGLNDQPNWRIRLPRTVTDLL